QDIDSSARLATGAQRPIELTALPANDPRLQPRPNTKLQVPNDGVRHSLIKVLLHFHLLACGSHEPGLAPPAMRGLKPSSIDPDGGGSSGLHDHGKEGWGHRQGRATRASSA